jgi:uncharacterized membrane protein
MIKKIITLIFLMMLLQGCGQDYNSNSGDYSQYAPVEGIDSSTPDGTRLLAAYKIMQTKCFQCHTWSSYKSSASWVSARLVTAGSTGGSDLYVKLKNVGGNMPPDPIAQLTAEELTAIEVWINNI